MSEAQDSIGEFLGDRMELRVLPVEEVSEWENNARIHTRRNIDALKKSIERFDQYKPIVVQKSSMRIIAGNGTYMAAIALGRKKILCNIIDVTDEEAEALAISDNRTGLLSQWEESVLTESLKKIQEQGNLDLTGFDEVDLEKMLSFQDGSAFEKIDLGRPKDPPKREEPAPVAEKSETVPDDTGEPAREVEYAEQITFTLDGFVFALDDEENIRELHCLMDLLKNSSSEDRDDVNRRLFSSLIDILTERFMR